MNPWKGSTGPALHQVCLYILTCTQSSRALKKENKENPTLVARGKARTHWKVTEKGLAEG